MMSTHSPSVIVRAGTITRPFAGGCHRSFQEAIGLPTLALIATPDFMTM